MFGQKIQRAGDHHVKPCPHTLLSPGSPSPFASPQSTPYLDPSSGAALVCAPRDARNAGGLGDGLPCAHNSRWMHWLLTTHVRRYVGHYRHSGHVWQGRFKAFPIQQDEHLLTVIRYVQRNPLRAGLVERAEEWRWSSLRRFGEGLVLDAGPVPRNADWTEFVNTPMTEAEVAAIRLSVGRDRPYGSDAWTNETAKLTGPGIQPPGARTTAPIASHPRPEPRKLPILPI